MQADASRHFAAPEVVALAWHGIPCSGVMHGPQAPPDRTLQATNSSPYATDVTRRLEEDFAPECVAFLLVPLSASAQWSSLAAALADRWHVFS